MRDDERSTNCEQLREDLSEFALGTISGRRRSEVLLHAETCPRCTRELDLLAIVADSVLELAPETEPPLGFELHVAQRLGTDRHHKKTKRLRTIGAVCVAAVSAVLLGFGLGTLSGGSHDARPLVSAPGLISANLTSHGQVIGEMFVSPGRPSWMFMTIDDDHRSGVVWCQLILTNGKSEMIGQFNLARGYGAWGSSLAASIHGVRGARILSASGVVLASATVTS